MLRNVVIFEVIGNEVVGPNFLDALYEKYQMKTAQAARREYLNNSSEPEKGKLVQA